MRSERNFRISEACLERGPVLNTALASLWQGGRTQDNDECRMSGVSKLELYVAGRIGCYVSVTISCSRERALPADPVINRLAFLSKQRTVHQLFILAQITWLTAQWNIHLHNISILIQREIWPWTTFTKSSVVSAGDRASPLITMNFRTRKVSFQHPDPGEFIYSKTTTYSNFTTRMRCWYCLSPKKEVSSSRVEKNLE